MQESELAIVYNAIHVFYSGQNNAEAAKWLNEFQDSHTAWVMCDRILGERRDALACCFAAQTLRQKILKKLKEVPKENYESLRESLINHLTHIHVVPNDQVSEATSTQLCLAIADLYIQVPEWNNFIVQLLNKFTSLEGDRTRMLLTLLKVFPEEVENSQVGENRRRAVREELAVNGGSMVDYLSMVLQQNVNCEDMVKKVVLCLSAMLSNPNVHTEQLAHNQILAFVFHILSTPNVSSSLHDTATECIVNAMLRAEDINSHRSFAIALHQATFNLQTAFNAAVAAEDLEKLQNFARVFVELCESLQEPVVNQNTDAAPLHDLHVLELLLLLAGHHDYTLIEMTFNVWYRISEGLFMIDDDDHVALFKPYITRYLHALYRHSRYDSDEVGVPDQTSEFADFRIKVCETVKDVAFIVGTDECIRMMFSVMQTCAQSNASWDETESALFIASKVIHNLLPEEDSIVPEIISQLVLLPSTSHPALLLTAIQFMGGCAEWLGKHPAMHDHVMQWLLSLIGRPEFAGFVSESVEKICAQAPLTRFIPSLLDSITRLQMTTTHAKSVEKACQEVTKAIACLCNSLPPSDVAVILKELCEPIMMRLKILVDADAHSFVDENKGDAWIQMAGRPIIWIDRLAAVFREIKPTHHENGNNTPPPWLSTAHNIWQIVSLVINKYQSESRVVEHSCRAVRHLVRALGVHSSGFVSPLVQQLMDVYSRHQHSCILYLSSVLVDEYGEVLEVRPGLLQMLTSLATTSFPLLQKEQGFRNHPDTVDDLYRLAARYIIRCPSDFFTHPLSRPLFDAALLALHVDHGEANRSVTRYFGEMLNQLISAKRSNFYDAGVHAANELITKQAAQLVEHALKAALFDVSSYLRRDISEIIFLIGKLDQNLLSQSLLSALSTLPRNALCATEAQLKEFHESVCRETDTRGVNCHVRELVKLYS